MNIDDIISSSLRIIDEQKPVVEKLSHHPLSNVLLKVANEVRTNKETFSVEELRPVLDLIKNAGDVSIASRAESAFWQGYKEAQDPISEAFATYNARRGAQGLPSIEQTNSILNMKNPVDAGFAMQKSIQQAKSKLPQQRNTASPAAAVRAPSVTKPKIKQPKVTQPMVAKAGACTKQHKKVVEKNLGKIGADTTPENLKVVLRAIHRKVRGDKHPVALPKLPPITLVPNKKELPPMNEE